MISETGASAIYGHRDPHQARWSEEYQAKVIKEECEVIFDNPRYCGLVFWHFCDAKSYITGGRVKGINDKGILSEYRQPKLAWQTISDYIKGKQK
jgi:beta-glucuronidase